MNTFLEKMAYDWVKSDAPEKIKDKYYCATRDVFQARLDGMVNARVTIVLADRGQGVLKTLKRVKPELENDEEALFTAFHERISGRAPEPRGNGLKFVREAIEGSKRHLTFISGSAKIELNEKVNISHTETIHGCLAVINNI